MSDKIDVEVRVYVTGYSSGAIDVAVFTTEPSGQVSWTGDMQIRFETKSVHQRRELNELLQNAVRRALWSASQLQFEK